MEWGKKTWVTLLCAVLKASPGAGELVFNTRGEKALGDMQLEAGAESTFKVSTREETEGSLEGGK